jgi:AAA+ ATPase superfamily predicted ATPase
MKNKPRNPFEYGRELGLPELINRGEERALIAATIRNRGKLFVIGPRRFGKTSLLAAAGEAAAAEGVIVLRLDAEKFDTLERLATALLNGATRQLSGPLEKTLSLVGRAAARLRPQISIDEEGRPVASLGITPGEGDLVPMLGDTLDAIEQMAAESGREVVVILDEVQHIVVEHGLSAERQLRSTVQGHKHVAYIFAGSATRLLNEMTSDPGRPFYRLGARLFLDVLPRSELIPALEDRFRKSGFGFEEGACALIVDRAADVPYNVQRLAHELWEMLREGRYTTVNGTSIEAALERVVRREDLAYTQIWTKLRKNQRLGLRAVITEGGESLLRSEVAKRVGITTPSLQKALGQLEQLDLIRQVSARGKSRWVLVDPFLAAWLKMAQGDYSSA